MHRRLLTGKFVTKKNKQQPKLKVLTEEKVQDTQARLEISIRKLLKRFAQETAVSLGSAFTATKLVNLCPSNINICA
jgi:hypothetical protein